MKILLLANTDWYLFNFRLGLMQALMAQGHDVVAVSPPGEFGERLRQHGVRWISFPMERRSLNPLRELGVLRRLTALYRRESPDIVHHFTIKCVVYGSFAARLSSRPLSVNAVAGLGTVFSSEKRRDRILRVAVKVLLRGALAGQRNQLILQNPDDARVFEQHRLISSERIHLIRGSGVDGRRFHVAPANRSAIDEASDDRSACRVLFAARLLWAKGIDHYVASARRLAADNVEFLVAGTTDPGNPGSVSDRQVAAWKQEGKVTFLDHVDDMQGLLQRVDVVVLPSVYGEGVPRILVEAAATGLPLIAYDVPGSREIVKDGVNGFLLPKGDQEGLSRAIGELLEEPMLRRSMGRRSRELFDQEYDQEIVVGKTISVYQLALSAS